MTVNSTNEGIVDGHWVLGNNKVGGATWWTLLGVMLLHCSPLLCTAHVRPGTIIYSDNRSAYNQLSAKTGSTHGHHTVNHSLHFVYPVTGAHTQGLEGMWSSCKRMM